MKVIKESRMSDNARKMFNERYKELRKSISYAMAECEMLEARRDDFEEFLPDDRNVNYIVGNIEEIKRLLYQAQKLL